MKKPVGKAILRGQSMAEFAMVMPILILLFFGLFFAAFYSWRAASADWAVFITGIGAGSYNSPATESARRSAMWGDIRARVSAGESGDKQVRSIISINDARGWIYGITNVEAQRASAYFRFWRFYPGPPENGDDD